MKNLKNIIVYSIIICLLLVTGVYYLVDNKASIKKTEANNVPANTSNTGNAGNAGNTTNTPLPNKNYEEVSKEVTAAVDSNPVVGVGRGENYETTTLTAVENAGGLKDIIKRGDVVLIKPNLCTLAPAGSPLITDYRTVQAIVKLVVELGASKVIIADGSISGNCFSSLYLGQNKYDQIKGVELVNLNSFNKKDCYELKPEKSLTTKGLFIPKIYMDADKVINIAKLKTHSQTVVSLSLKNSMGVPSGEIYGLANKGALHSIGLEKSIVDLNRIRIPDFSIIEGIVGGEGLGPTSNTPVKSNIIFAGKDLLALDTVALTFMGLKVEDIPHIKLAVKEKMGVSSLDKIKVNGADINSIKMKFKRADE